MKRLRRQVRDARPRRQRGVALVVALLVVAIAVILVAALLDRGELALARTRNVLRGEQADAYALGLDAYAAQVLLAAKSKGDADTHASAWAMPLPPQDVPGGTIAASMRDLGGCFNLNNLAVASLSPQRAHWATVFDALLGALQVNDPALRPAIEAWLGQGPDGGSGVNAYLSRSPPYRPRGGLFAHVSELRLVRGVEAATYARLAPHVCALPPGTKINVDTATLPVLSALTGSRPAAESRWQGGHAQWKDVDQFLDAQPPATTFDRAVMHQLADVHSAYFLLRGDILLDGVPFTTWSVIGYAARVGPQVVARSRGSDEALVDAAPIGAQAAR